MNPDIQDEKHKGKGPIIAIAAAGLFAAFVTAIVTILIKKRQARYQSILSRKRLCKFSHFGYKLPLCYKNMFLSILSAKLTSIKCLISLIPASKLSIKLDGIRSFTFREMSLATNNFDNSNQVGEGGYGTVFKGILSDKTIVAIKRAKEGSVQGQKEFLTEISLLSRLHHRNLVSLLGYCDEEGEQV